MKNLLFILSIVFATASFANNNNEKLKSFSLSGKVVDNGGSLTGVKVVLDNKEIVVYTDFEGNFSINNVLEGDHVISFSMVAYDTEIIKINPKNRQNINIKLYGK